MFGLDYYEILFLMNALLIQVLLIVHFALRKWRFDLALHYGWIVYALGLPAAILGVFFLRHGMDWAYWLGGFIYLSWAILGYVVEYILKIDWRSSKRMTILVPYVILFLATEMFYWWPLALLNKSLWYVYALLFLASTYLNVTSHKKAGIHQLKSLSR